MIFLWWKTMKAIKPIAKTSIPKVPKNSTVETFDWDPMVWRKYIYAFWSCEYVGLKRFLFSKAMPILNSMYEIILNDAKMKLYVSEKAESLKFDSDNMNKKNVPEKNKTKPTEIQIDETLYSSFLIILS
jgi:hypothetical protein